MELTADRNGIEGELKLKVQQNNLLKQLKH